MKERFLSIGSAVAAFVASLCCLGPLLLGGIGIGAALTAMFAPLRPYFLALSAVLLAMGFYFAYRKPKPAEPCASEVCAADSRTGRVVRPLLWLATLAVAALAFFPAYGGKLVGGGRAVAAPVATAELKTAELKISGMVCEACADVVKHKLMETPGVAQADVNYAAGHATVKYDPTRAAPTQLVEAVNATGHRASLAN